MDRDMNHLPLLTSNNDIPSPPTEDVEMEFEASQHSGGGSLPEPMEVSDLSDSSSDSGSVQQDIGIDYRQPASPAPSSTILPSRPAAPRSNNRRPRVEDDEDEGRDRRHPSQRIGDRFSDSDSNSNSQTPSLSPPPTRPHTARIRTAFNIPSLTRIGIDQRDPFRFFQHLMPQQTVPRNATNVAAMANNNDLSAAQQEPQPSNENATRRAPPTPQAQNPQLHGGENDSNPQPDFAAFAEMLMQVGFLGAALGSFVGEPEADDPDRAGKLIEGLEGVPIGLVRRLERVGGTDNEEAGRDTMCAICWDQLLDNAGFGGSASSKEPLNGTSDQESTSSDPPTSRHPSPPAKDELSKHKHSKIVALPCAHVFHADCLIPWFSRPKQTTCPTCRFNIDPENLTRTRRRRAMPRMPTELPVRPTPNDNQTEQHTADNVEHPIPGQDGNDNTNRPTGQFTFDQLRIPVVISGQPFPFNFGGENEGGQGDGIPNPEIMDQLRASVEERLRTRAGQGPPQPTTDNAGFSDDAALHDDPSLPPLEPWPPQPSDLSASESVTNVPSSPSAQTVTPTQPQPQPSSQPNPRIRPGDGRGTTHSIVFGLDVLVGGPMFPGGNTMDVDDGADNGNDNGNWMGMMMQDMLDGHGGADVSGPNDGHNGPRNNNVTTNADRETTGAGEAQNRGFPRFLNMNLGNGESLHIASGTGRTMGEAVAQLLNGMGMSPPGAPDNRNGEAEQNTATNTNTNTNTNISSNTTMNEDSDPPDGPSEMGQNYEQEGEEGNAGTNPGMGLFPMQFLARLMGLGSPVHTRQRQRQGQDQPSETTAHSQMEPNINHPQPHEEGTAPQPTFATNTNNEGAFARFLRSVVGSLQTRPPDQEDNTVPPNMAFFPPGFPPPTGTTPTNAPPSEKKQWAPPPAPGPTLRQRIEKREREVGLRCYDMSCGVGPSDEDPVISMTAEGMKQLILRPVNVDGTTSTEKGAQTCVHTFHPACLVTTERVALRGAEAPVVGDDVEVSCSVCRGVGRVSKKEWEEGVQQLS